MNNTWKWPGFFTNMINGSTSLLVPVGVSGILYPPNSINVEVFNKKIFKKISLYADDLWLKTMGMMNGTKIKQTSCFPGHFFTIRYTQEKALFRVNLIKKMNDFQLSSLFKYYKLRISNNILNKSIF
jgi:hypothetical protein